jgi:hypothetical protein
MLLVPMRLIHVEELHLPYLKPFAHLFNAAFPPTEQVEVIILNFIVNNRILTLKQARVSSRFDEILRMRMESDK